MEKYKLTLYGKNFLGEDVTETSFTLSSVYRLTDLIQKMAESSENALYIRIGREDD